MKINKKTLSLVILFCLILVIGIQLIAVAIEVPLSLHYSNSNTDWWQYQFDNYPDYTNHNCGPACSAMLINYLRGKGITTTYYSSISSAYPEVHCYARWDYCKANGHSNGYDNSDWSSPGATTEQIISALSSENIQIHTFTGYDCCNDGRGITNLKNAIDQGKVCICLVDPSYYRVTDCHSHWVVAYGYDSNYIYLNDPGYITGEGFQASNSDFADALWEVTELSTVIVSDTTIYNYPTVDSFNVTPTSITLGNSINTSYTVSDDIGLQQTELWRVNDVGGEPGNWDTLDNPIFTKVLSGEKNYSGSFTNTPDTAGTYWYGMHVVDTSGNWSVEPKPPGPIMVTVTNPTSTIYVPDDYSTIQAAVNAASPGDTIIMRDGTYTENVDVNKDHLTIRSENGAEVTFVQAAKSNTVFNVIENYVNISGVTVKDASGEGESGILLEEANHCNIFDNKISNNEYGITLYSSSSNKITNNIVHSNQNRGIDVMYSSNDNIINNNNISDNAEGIEVYYSKNNTITGNEIISNSKYNGIYLADEADNSNISNNTFIDNGLSISNSFQNTIEGNTVNGKPLVYLEDVSDCVISDAGQVILVNCNNITIKDLDLFNTSVGIELWGTDDSKIMNNSISSNSMYGIRLFYGSNNIITNNNINSNNWNGIRLGYSSENVINNNNVSLSQGSGIYLSNSPNNIIDRNNISYNDCGIYLYTTQGIPEQSKNNKIYLNNFMDNTDHVRSGYGFSSGGPPNIWNSTEEITYTYNGKSYMNYLGNYWDNYTAADTDNDGIGDTPYNTGVGQDNYPLIEPFENYTPAENQPPTVQITSGPSGTIDYDDVTFTWNGNDPDGEVTGYYYGLDNPTPDTWTTETSHTFNNVSEGNHTFYVQAKDDKGATSSVISRSFSYTPPVSTADISLEEVEICKMSSYNLDTNNVSVNVKFKNIGEVIIDSFQIELYINGELKHVEKEDNKNLAPGASGIGLFYCALSKEICGDNIKMEIKITDVNPVESNVNTENNSKTKILSIYYVPFDLKSDAYSFINPEYNDWPKLRSTLDKLLNHPIRGVIFWFLAKAFKAEGACYGMASTVIAYKEGSLTIPYGGYVNDLELAMIEVRNNILVYQLNPSNVGIQVLRMVDQRISNFPSILTEYQKVIDFLQEGNLIMLTLGESGKFGGAHQLVAYQCITDKATNIAYVYVYDSNCPEKEIILSIPLNLGGTISYVGYDMIWVEDLKPLPTDLIEEYFNDLVDLIYDGLKSAGQELINIFSSVDTLITDEYGRKIGCIDDSPINEIPDGVMEIFGDFQTYQIPLSLNYDIQITGKEQGVFELHLTKPNPDDTMLNLVYEDVPTENNSEASLTIGPSVIDFTMQLDQDGDGVVDEIKDPDFIEGVVLLIGDFGSANGGSPDCIVDFEDLMIFAMAYGATPSDANWNPVCDIAAPDGIIDFEDLMVFAMHYGETCADL